MLRGIIENTRRQKPLVHCLTNYVTVNDCANVLLAGGGSPIMADDLREAAEITALCRGLVINIGTLNERTIETMIQSGKKANALNLPVILDPVGAGASTFRTETVHCLMSQIRFAVIRGNMSEIKNIGQGKGFPQREDYTQSEEFTQGEGFHQGVDAADRDRLTEENLEMNSGRVRRLALETGAVIAVTGAMDLVSDGRRMAVCRNGHPELGRITGTGCMLSAVTGAYAAANPNRMFEAALAAVCAMGISGERAYQWAQAAGGGTGTMKMHLMDQIDRMTDGRIESEARYEVW
jgi:hydroxyethylthiazole kinase